MGVFVAQALQDPNRNAAYLLQGGLGMPDREYYLSTAAPMVKTRDAYRKYLADLGAALGWPDAKARADARVRARNQDRAGARRCRRGAGRQGAEGMDRRGVSVERAGHGLARLLRRRPARRPAESHRLAPEADRRPVGARREPAARRVEGLSEAAPGQPLRQRPAQEVRRPPLRLLRPRAGGAAAASARAKIAR